MGTDSRIPWTDHTWNPWQGCQKVSDGCKHCYMERDKVRYGQDPTEVIRSAPGTFNSPIARDRKGNFKWADGSRIFVCSWSDFFHRDANRWRDEAWELIRQRRDLIFMLLTKRPERVSECLPRDWGQGWKNAWLLVTVEMQKYLYRFGEILKVPALVHGISVEPILERVHLRPSVIKDVDWVIAGAESWGPGRPGRPARGEWFRRLRDQCIKSSIPFFLKQMDIDGKLVEIPLLDGKRWAEHPDN